MAAVVTVVLYKPQIPQNTGNIIRTCSVTGTSLALVPPFGFTVNDRWLKRAGLDYFENTQIEIVEDLEKTLIEAKQPFYLFSSKVQKAYTECSFDVGNWLIFGSETEGLPQCLFQQWPDRFATIPMLPHSRCLNLATSVGIVLYEALRQQNFGQLLTAKSGKSRHPSNGH